MAYVCLIIVWIVISLFMLLAYLDCYYEVDKIMDKTTSAGDTYQVKLKDGGPLQWIAAYDLNPGDLITEFKLIHRSGCYSGTD